MKQIKTCTEAVHLLQELLPLYLGIRKGDNTIEISGEDLEEDSDFCVTIDGWLIITPYIAIEERPSIPEPIEFKTIHYQISKVVPVHGGRHEPDSVDIVPLEKFRSATLAIESAMHYLLDNDLSQIGEMLAEKDMDKCDAEYLEEIRDQGNQS